MTEKRFNPKKLNKLNNPERYKALPPELIIEKASLNNPDIIIDYGAGTGFYSTPFSERFPNSKIYACDIAQVMVDWMNENLKNRYENIVPLKMEDNQVPLKDEIADLLFMINLHHELDSPNATLKECKRLLKPNGKIVISDWKKLQMEQGPPLNIRVDEDEVVEQLKKAGFVNIKTCSELALNYLIIAENRQ